MSDLLSGILGIVDRQLRTFVDTFACVFHNIFSRVTGMLKRFLGSARRLCDNGLGVLIDLCDRTFGHLDTVLTDLPDFIRTLFGALYRTPDDNFGTFLQAVKAFSGAMNDGMVGDLDCVSMPSADLTTTVLVDLSISLSRERC